MNNDCQVTPIDSIRWYLIWGLVVAVVGCVHEIYSLQSEDMTVHAIRLCAFAFGGIGTSLLLWRNAHGFIVWAVGTLVYLGAFVIQSFPDIEKAFVRHETSGCVSIIAVLLVVSAGLLIFAGGLVKSWLNSNRNGRVQE